MGYRVGWQCFATQELADDYILSQQQPTIGADGSIIRPVKQGSQWILQGKPVVLSHPHCEIGQQLQYGAAAGFGIVMLFALVAVFQAAYRLAHGIGDDDGR